MRYFCRLMGMIAGLLIVSSVLKDVAETNIEQILLVGVMFLVGLTLAYVVDGLATKAR